MAFCLLVEAAGLLGPSNGPRPTGRRRSSPTFFGTCQCLVEPRSAGSSFPDVKRPPCRWSFVLLVEAVGLLGPSNGPRPTGHRRFSPMFGHAPRAARRTRNAGPHPHHIRQIKKGHPVGDPCLFGGGGGNRTRVRKSSAIGSTCLSSLLF